MGKNTIYFITQQGDAINMSHNQKKDAEKTVATHLDQEENVSPGEKSPEFDVFGTALNDLHSPFEF
ncbi:hypothetical protein [Bacillus sp. OK048]|uniref:hypothetical protein n=1 Tax=Bacillus sp. OK048 TaxID=1882761 RepID=UPI001C31A40B|nr:hypothetical protein [Bacillus sp. OK048]